MTTAAPWCTVLQAPAAWRVVDFISDLHLQAGEPATLQTWQRYMASTPADAVFILGDLFEVWVGDDAAAVPGFEQDCGQVLAATARCRHVFFMPGNRDFLLGKAFLETCRMQELQDPTVLAFAGQRWLLSHGDALCLDDTDYQKFRAQVRSPAWQEAFLARPLAERQALARGMRQQSEARKQTSAPADYADVDAATARQWLQAAGASTLIHGHTHRPADHDLGAAADRATDGAEDGSASRALRRVVLSDWEAGASPPRAQILRGSAHGLQRIDIA
jgi:UDP-2,3-diacylglucosamine hydrolase